MLGVTPYYCCCSLVKSCLTLRNPMDCSMPGFPVPHHLLESVQVYVHSLFIREMQVRTIMRYHFTPIRVTIVKKSTDNKRWRGRGKKGTLLRCCWECKLVQPLWRTVWWFLKKSGNRTAILPSNPTAGHTHQGNKNWKRHVYPNVHRSTVYNSQDMKAT